ncbi:hypothetical protein DPMN_103739 [Dreissena polymorpha]|uniref:Long-chain-fatty-acid--CoA ligase n=2 Tax=Dreissena polymorpha TaxID=45954 RepID=A0A9D4JZG0_DREPO|nr:hypothetical protein DPMN_103739 [Dreissena polymorpha]
MDWLIPIGGSIIGLVGVGYVLTQSVFPWLIPDIRYLSKVLPTLRVYNKWGRQGLHFIDIFETRVREMPDKVLIMFEDRTHTYQEMNAEANRVARVAHDIMGLKVGDTVAYLQVNTPEYISTVFGLMKVGVCGSLINTNLRGKSLLHCITASQADILIVGSDPDLLEAVSAIYDEIANMSIYIQGSSSNKNTNFKRLDELTKNVSADDIPREWRAKKTVHDPALYIFTSGTTGLPKPAVLSVKKASASYLLSQCAGLRDSDVMYITLPLYHSSATIVGVFNVVMTGATGALGRKFSKSNFFPDCRRYGVTVILYIGELCRYLLTNEESSDDKNHSIRLAIGNGLRQDIFANFRTRFGIPNIAEFYAATEGTAGFMNILNVDGACGRSSPLLERVIPAGFFKWDVGNECVKRGADGLCIPAAIDEPGLCLGPIVKEFRFDGYHGKKELTESKLIRDVRKKGDVYFNTGDLMRRDRLYNLYFCDRIGDTFRWKGENVSTTEVSNSVTELSDVIDACVYGVTVPGCDGQAGMVTLLLDRKFEDESDQRTFLHEFLDHCENSLPVYARPLFVRIAENQLELTSTLKQ